MKNSSRSLLGIICLAIGSAVMISIILPSGIWTALVAFVLIGCGVLFLLY